MNLAPTTASLVLHTADWGLKVSSLTLRETAHDYHDETSYGTQIMSELMEQQSQATQGMFPTDHESYRPPGESHVDTTRALNPHTSIEDYSRVMLQYTQNRMSGFTRLDDDKGSHASRSSRSSDTGNESGDSASGVLSRQPNGYNSTTRSSSGSLGNSRSSRDNSKPSI